MATASDIKKVLIVDDDRLLAATLRAMVEDFATFDARCAVTVDVVADGHEAGKRLESDEAFDVVLCDLTLPGPGGLALYERLRARGSPVADRFVLVTGAGALGDGADTRKPPPCLRKPFDADGLAAVLGPLLR